MLTPIEATKKMIELFGMSALPKEVKASFTRDLIRLPKICVDYQAAYDTHAMIDADEEALKRRVDAAIETPPFEAFCFYVKDEEADNPSHFFMLLDFVDYTPEDRTIRFFLTGFTTGEAGGMIPVNGYITLEDDDIVSNFAIYDVKTGEAIEAPEDERDEIFGIVRAYFNIAFDAISRPRAEVVQMPRSVRQHKVGGQPILQQSFRMIDMTKVVLRDRPHLGGSHRSPAPHDRRGHYVHRKDGKVFWRKAAKVKGGSEAGGFYRT